MYDKKHLALNYSVGSNQRASQDVTELLKRALDTDRQLFDYFLVIPLSAPYFRSKLIMHLVQLQNPAADGALTELVSTLASAGSSLKNLKFDLVILDKNLPDGSGIDFIKTIKSVNQVLPVVILTSDSELNSINEALELGAEDYLIKTPDIIANLLIKVPFLIRQNARKKELEFNNLGLPKSEINLSSKNYESFLKYAERSYIQRAIKICGGNATRASNSLGISKATIYRKLTEWESLQKDNA